MSHPVLEKSEYISDHPEQELLPADTSDSLQCLDVAIVDDCRHDAFLVEYALRKSSQPFKEIHHFGSLSEFLLATSPTPDVVVLDRVMPDTGLTEARIREIRARHNRCGVIVHTSALTPSLRSTAAHEGAVAVVEKGSLTPEALGMIVASAAIIGPQMDIIPQFSPGTQKQ